MKKVFAYIRVSTAKQGEHGVSLVEQRDAISRYAVRNALDIVEWFEERQTAAKRGRPVFARMLRLLRSGKATGVAMHKIDRSARNLKDWADLGELLDRGIEMHFASESLDLHSRGGRLSADIQAVVAADFIRNLREETRKGFYGRLKQGLYPLPAPLGYVNQGKGKPKTVDAIRGPLVRQAFDLYASGRFNLEGLVSEMHRVGLRNRNGGRVTRNGMSVLLNNPFYVGLIRLHRSGENFSGIHEPLVHAAVFAKVQARLRGKARNTGTLNCFLFRRMLRCGHCRRTLIGELQKGHIYYRCHTQSCQTKTVREETAESALRAALQPLRFSQDEKDYLSQRTSALHENWDKEREAVVSGLQLRIDRTKERIVRLTDAVIDGILDRELFEGRKGALLMERTSLEHELAALTRGEDVVPAKVARYLELAGNALLSYELASLDEKRELVLALTSNQIVREKNVEFELREPFFRLAEMMKLTNSDPYRDTPRTLDKAFDMIVDWTEAEVEKGKALQS